MGVESYGGQGDTFPYLITEEDNMFGSPILLLVNNLILLGVHSLVLCSSINITACNYDYIIIKNKK